MFPLINTIFLHKYYNTNMKMMHNVLGIKFLVRQTTHTTDDAWALVGSG